MKYWTLSIKWTCLKIVRWNSVKLGYQEFITRHNTNVFENIECPDVVSPLLFSQCIYYYIEVVPDVANEVHKEDGQVYTKKVTTNKEVEVFKNTKHFIVSDDDRVAQLP